MISLASSSYDFTIDSLVISTQSSSCSLKNSIRLLPVLIILGSSSILIGIIVFCFDGLDEEESRISFLDSSVTLAVLLTRGLTSYLQTERVKGFNDTLELVFLLFFPDSFKVDISYLNDRVVCTDVEGLSDEFLGSILSNLIQNDGIYLCFVI